MQGIMVLRLNAQDLLIELASVAQPAGFMKSQRVLQQN
jgi:hypothetical protein